MFQSSSRHRQAVYEPTNKLVYVNYGCSALLAFATFRRARRIVRTKKHTGRATKIAKQEHLSSSYIQYYPWYIFPPSASDEKSDDIWATIWLAFQKIKQQCSLRRNTQPCVDRTRYQIYRPIPITGIEGDRLSVRPPGWVPLWLDELPVTPVRTGRDQILFSRFDGERRKY